MAMKQEDLLKVEKPYPGMVVPTKDMPREMWLKWRKFGFGGSDISAILGLNKYRSKYQVYLEKIGQFDDEPELDNQAIEFGNDLEDFVARKFVERIKKNEGIKLRIRRDNHLRFHKEHDFLFANVDRMIIGENAGLECKTASEWLNEVWEDGRIPDPYLLQCQHYMNIYGADYWYIAALVGGNKFYYYKIDRDQALIDYIEREAKDFWENYIIPRIAPDPDGSDSCTNLMNSLYPSADPASIVEFANEEEIAGMIAEREYWKEQEKVAKEKKDEYTNLLKNQMKSFEIGIAMGHQITWKDGERSYFNHKKLQVDHPEIFEQYYEKAPTRTMRFKIAKGGN